MQKKLFEILFHEFFVHLCINCATICLHFINCFSGQQSSSGQPQKSTTSSPPSTSGASCTTAKEKTEVKAENLSSRIVPIKLLETGESIMPTFTTLENPQPPEWSTFSKLNKAKERHVPLNVEHDLPKRGRERAKTSSGTTSKEDSKSQKPQSRSSSAKKNTVCTYICRSTFSA